jgi:hypothetical protein
LEVVRLSRQPRPKDKEQVRQLAERGNRLLSVVYALEESEEDSPG